MDLTAEEARVLGCLLEKERTTPDAYPLSANGVLTACNQSTNRFPVVAYDETIVQDALDRLRVRGLTRRGVYPGSRVIKHRHVLDEELQLSVPQLAVLCVLLLRGPQTPGELKGRTDRLHRFAGLSELGDCIEALASRDEPLVRRLVRDPGQKEARVATLLAGPLDQQRDASRAPESAGPGPAAPGAQRGRVDPALLEARVADLEEAVATLRADLETLRRADAG